MLLPPTIFLKVSSKHTRPKYPRQYFFSVPPTTLHLHLFFFGFGSILPPFTVTLYHGKYVLLFFLPTPRVVSKGDGSVMPRRHPRPLEMAAAKDVTLWRHTDVTPRRHDRHHPRRHAGHNADSATPESALADARLALTHARTGRRNPGRPWRQPGPASRPADAAIPQYINCMYPCTSLSAVLPSCRSDTQYNRFLPAYLTSCTLCKHPGPGLTWRLSVLTSQDLNHFFFFVSGCWLA
jgi:hypothetical protein